MPRGTTADSIKVSWVNGRRVNVDSVDFTAAKSYDEENMVRGAGTMQNKSDINSKAQADAAVWVAQDDA